MRYSSAGKQYSQTFRQRIKEEMAQPIDVAERCWLWRTAHTPRRFPAAVFERDHHVNIKIGGNPR
jgi:hypothetical protein